MYFFFNDTATTEIYTYGHTLSLHDALPICRAPVDLRVNRLKGDPDRVAQHYPDAARIAGLPDALRLPEGAPVELSDPWKWGQVEVRSEEHTSELQSLMRISYAVFCLKKKKPTPVNTRERKTKP